ncbi:MAG TPA: YegS/Rv2252/BmrU family lipid kinase [Gemmatimonadaceae bacterium]|nr:YegS/Rv2252/BmrU family lipid kinase [Gemmatimonadaceae bacterium]
MKRKLAQLIINPRLGKNVERLSDILAVFSAAGWKTRIALKEFGGHTMQLAEDAAEDGCELVIGYGGDGTLSEVVNGVMASRPRGRTVGVIPGGTSNVWAHEIGLPEDPVKAALLLINSEGRKVDLGHVEADARPFPRSTSDRQREPLTSGGRHHFLLMAGLGIDAAILRRVNKPLKEKIGEAAVALAAAKELPSQRAFPIEIRASGAGGSEGVHWAGEALQVIIGNTRRYGNITEVTPEAYIDDGILDVCVITAGDPLTTVQQILSILLHREPGGGRSEYFQAAHFWISVPASVDLQLDGSRVKPEDCQSAASPKFPKQAESPDAIVTYRFDAMPRALRVAIPRTYSGALFEERAGKDKAPAAESQGADQRPQRTVARKPGPEQRESTEQMDELLKSGRKVTVVGTAPNPERKGTFVVAGVTSDNEADEAKPVAVRIDDDTSLVTSWGESRVPIDVAALPEGGVIVVEGKQSKRGVIRAKRVAVVP